MRLSPELQRACEERGFMTADGRLDRTAIAKEVVEFLMRDHTTSETAVSNRAIARHVFGVENPGDDAIQLVSSLTGKIGRVQKIINGAGGVLLAVRGDEIFESEQSGRLTRRVNLRFVSMNDEEIWRLGIETEADSFKRKADRTQEFLRVVAERRPALQSRIRKFPALAQSKVDEGLLSAPRRSRETAS